MSGMTCSTGGVCRTEVVVLTEATVSIAQSISERLEPRLSRDSRAFLGSLSPAGSAGVLRLVAEVVELVVTEDAKRRQREIASHRQRMTRDETARYLGVSVTQVRLDETLALDVLFEGLMEQLSRRGDPESRQLGDVATLKPGLAFDRIRALRPMRVKLPCQEVGCGVLTLNDVPVAIVNTERTVTIEARMSRGVAIEVFKGGCRRSVHRAAAVRESVGTFGGAA